MRRDIDSLRRRVQELIQTITFNSKEADDDPDLALFD